MGTDPCPAAPHTEDLPALASLLPEDPRGLPPVYAAEAAQEKCLFGATHGSRVW